MKKTVVFYLIIAALALPGLDPNPVHAHGAVRTNSIILDDEIEAALLDWLEKIFKAAKLERYTPKPYIVVDSSLNAAAASGGKIYINTGLIFKCKHVSELLGILAHETGHIAGGHLSRLDESARHSAAGAFAAALLGGAVAAMTQNSDPLIAGMMGAQQVYQRSLLNYSRSEESSADQAAISYLKTLKWPEGLKGLHTILSKFLKRDPYQDIKDAYEMTHPLTKERLQAIETALKTMKNKVGMPEHYQKTFLRIQAKLQGYIAPQQAFKKYPESDQSFPAQYARAIAYGVSGQPKKALQAAEILATAHPTDPYIHELHGQLLFESGNYPNAEISLEKAVQLRSRSPLIRMMLAQVQLKNAKHPKLKKAEENLRFVVTRLPRNVMGWRLLATAQGQQGKTAEAALSLAEEAMLLGNSIRAKGFAERAQRLAKPHQKSIRLKASDIINQT